MRRPAVTEGLGVLFFPPEPSFVAIAEFIGTWLSAVAEDDSLCAARRRSGGSVGRIQGRGRRWISASGNWTLHQRNRPRRIIVDEHRRGSGLSVLERVEVDLSEGLILSDPLDGQVRRCRSHTAGSSHGLFVKVIIAARFITAHANAPLQVIFTRHLILSACSRR